MKNNLKKHISWIIITTIVTLIPMFVGLIMWQKLPDRLPTHYNFAGEADDYSSKAFAVFFVPLFCLVIQAFIILACSTDPKNSGGKAVSDKIYRLVLLIVPVTSVFSGILIYGTALGFTMNVLTASQLFLAMIFICLGNYIPKVRQNYTIGVRLPWTLENPEIWTKTNRLTGWLMTLCGFFILLNAFLEVGGATGFIVLLIALTIVLSIIPSIYSYILYKKVQSIDSDTK